MQRKKKWIRIGPAPHMNLLMPVLVLVAFGITGTLLLTPSRASDLTTDILARFVPGTLHEGIPHGVPSSFDWRTKTILKNISPPTADMTYINLRGVVYTDESNVRPANTRVEITGCQTYGLKNSTNSWQKIFDFPATYITGKGWKENFSAPGGAAETDIQTESDGYRSFVTVEGYNLHFFTNTNKVPLVNVGSQYRHFVSGCSTRLVLDDPSGPDDRSQSHYMILIGHDWKTASNGCTTNSYGSTLCYSMGAGKFIYPEKSWRRVVYSTMSGGQIASEPRPPTSVLQNPDGTYGDSETMPPDETPTSTPPSDKDPSDKPGGSGSGSAGNKTGKNGARTSSGADNDTSKGGNKSKSNSTSQSTTDEATDTTTSDKGAVQQTFSKIAQRPVAAGVLIGTVWLIAVFVVALFVPTTRYAIIRFIKLILRR